MTCLGYGAALRAAIGRGAQVESAAMAEPGDSSSRQSPASFEPPKGWHSKQQRREPPGEDEIVDGLAGLGARRSAGIGVSSSRRGVHVAPGHEDAQELKPAERSDVPPLRIDGRTRRLDRRMNESGQRVDRGRRIVAQPPLDPDRTAGRRGVASRLPMIFGDGRFVSEPVGSKVTRDPKRDHRGKQQERQRGRGVKQDAEEAGHTGIVRVGPLCVPRPRSRGSTILSPRRYARVGARQCVSRFA